jgi:hypothetical protein
MIGYVTIGTDDSVKARAFSDALLGKEGPRAVCAYFRDPEGNKFCAFRTGPVA